MLAQSRFLEEGRPGKKLCPLDAAGRNFDHLFPFYKRRLADAVSPLIFALRRFADEKGYAPRGGVLSACLNRIDGSGRRFARRPKLTVLKITSQWKWVNLFFHSG